MNLHRFVKPVAALLLTTGLLIGGAVPADATTTVRVMRTDTGWGR